VNNDKCGNAVTGDEVLHGQIVDTNAAWLADFFFNQGLPLTRRNTVGDDLDSLVTVLRERSEQADVRSSTAAWGQR
jgi:molybdopterin-biosynthesis enzyme MoeA-like protein